MSRLHYIVGAALLLALLAGCSLTGPSTAPPTSPSADFAAAGTTPTDGPSPTSPPADTPAPTFTASPRPVPTSTPTLSPASPTTPATPSSDLLGTMNTIEAEVEDLRGLEAKSPITRTLMTRQELTTYLEREFLEEYPPEEVETDVRVLAAFDFVSEDFDLQGLLLDLYASQILGLYDDEEDTFYIITEAAQDELDLLDRLTFAHEFIHGLQDQHFGLETFVDEEQLNDDEVLARMSLVEGDAYLAMTQYLMAHLFELSPEELATLQDEDMEASQEVLDAAPPIIRETFLFPVFHGQEFVMILQGEGWDAVTAAFADPPQSTEQILHPGKYFAGDEPQIVTVPPLTGTLGSGWQLIEVETLGEFQTSLYLGQYVDQATAELASEGWDGDQYALYVKGDADLLVFATAWDSLTDREEFVDAYGQYAEVKYGQSATRSGGGEIWWETRNQTACVAWVETRATVILGPDPATVAAVLAAVQP
jgi:hypothetical protein